MCIRDRVDFGPPMLAMSQLSAITPFVALSTVRLICSEQLNLESIITRRYFTAGFDSSTSSPTRTGITVGIFFLVKTTTSILLSANVSLRDSIQMLIYRITVLSLIGAWSVVRAATSATTSSAYPTKYDSSGDSHQPLSFLHSIKQRSVPKVIVHHPY